MLQQKELIELNKDEDFILFLMINKFEVKTSKSSKPYLSLELRDKSTIISANIWDNYEELLKELSEGKIVKVAGTIGDYNGTPQIKIKKIRLAKEEDNVTAEDFIPKSSRSLHEMIEELSKTIDSVQNKFLNELLNKIFQGEKLEKFMCAPAGKSWHHSYLHGLLEHTLEIVRICDLMCSIHSEINRDLLITGALLHDFGKIEELKYDSTFDYTDKGKLIGHIMVGALTVESAANSIKDFPEELKNQLIHLILSHQGKLEFASPVEPKTLEAIVLYQADELSAKTNAYKYAIRAEKNKNGKWTKYLPLANTSLYIPNINDELKNNHSQEEGSL